jgi:hypothetical protein
VPPYGYEQQPPAYDYSYDQQAYGQQAYGYPAPPPKKGHGVMIAVLVGCLVIGAAITLAPILFFNKVMSDASEITSSFDGSQTQQILDNDLEVTFGDWESPENEYDRGRLPVTLKNKGGDRATFRVQIEAVNDGGERIGTTSVSADRLAAGQSTSEKSIFPVSEDKEGELATATFNILSVTKTDF